LEADFYLKKVDLCSPTCYFYLGSEQTKIVYVTFSILLSQSEELSMYLSSPFAEILHKLARKIPTMTPAESHARNHIGHPFLPLIENSHFLHPLANFTVSKK